MPDWTASMQQTFEYYVVDPGTWRDTTRLNVVTSSSINIDSTTETLGSASFDVVESVGECYIRTYLVTIQNGVKEKRPLGTHLVQTPSSKFDGKIRSVSMDAYTPLIELKEKMPPIGYSLLKGDNIMDNAYLILREQLRAPVSKISCEETLPDNFVSDPSENWCSFVTDLISTAKYSFDLDEMGRVLFAPKQDTASLQPIWTYDDGNSSILYHDVTFDHDMYGVPNVVEVVYSNGFYDPEEDTTKYSVRVSNDDPNSPVSTVSRGREIMHRVTNPEIGNPTKNQLLEYAERVLREMSTLEYSISYTHAYCPVRVGDCVRINYDRAGLTGIKAKVISQSIKCEPGCPVSEKAVFTQKLWG